jgi:hypothetical protein
MDKCKTNKLVFIIIILSILMITGCSRPISSDNPQENNNTNVQGETNGSYSKGNSMPSISGVHLGDTKEQVRAVLGDKYVETPPDEEPGHFPEPVYCWTYEAGYMVFFGKDSGKVLEIIATSSEAETNLGAKIGDTSDKVFSIYRPKYIEPVSVHGDQLIGIFKVEGGAALVFGWDQKDGKNPEDIKPEDKVVSMILTYPSILDDSF